VASRAEHIQGLTVAEEDRGLAIADDHVRTDAIITDSCVVGEAMDDLVRHFICVFNYIKDTSHIVSPYDDELVDYIRCGCLTQAILSFFIYAAIPEKFYFCCFAKGGEEVG
jgi:hypothetical protein